MIITKRNPLDDIAKLLNIVTRDIIEKDREKSKAVISITMVNAASKCAKFVASTIITNNVDNNRDQIEYNARHLVNSVYYDAYSKLNMYRGDEDYLSHYMKEEWKEDIYGDIINIVYNKKKILINVFLRLINVLILELMIILLILLIRHLNKMIL